jgi:lysophospholipase L1-like esterase
MNEAYKNAMNAPSDSPGQSRPTITIVGFGACTINGYPVDEKDSFLRKAIAQTQPEVDAEIKCSITALTACLAPAAAESLEENVFPHHPDIVVLQFGQSDAKIAVRRAWNEVLGRPKKKISRPPVQVANRPPNFGNRMNAFLRGCGSLALGARPVTSRSDYRRSIAKMVDSVVSFGAYPIVFTPFVHDNFLSDAWARCYSCDLTADFGGRADVCVINGWKLLAQYPRNQTLLHDGLHLSQWGHEVLAQSLRPKLVEWIQARASKRSSTTESCAHGLG